MNAVRSNLTRAKEPAAMRTDDTTYSWSGLYAAAVHETDSGKAVAKVLGAEAAMLHRVWELDPERDEEELEAIWRAANNMIAIRATGGTSR